MIRKTWLVLACMFFTCAMAAEPAASIPQTTDDIDQLLRTADSVKVSSYAEFEVVINKLSSRTDSLSNAQQEYLRYLKGWQLAYKGDYQGANALLKDIADTSQDVTIRFRAIATIVNVAILAKQYETAFIQMRQLLELLSSVSDKGAREQGLSVVAYLYNNIADYESALTYARLLKEENWRDRGACTGGQLELQALYVDSTVQLTNSRFQEVIDACEQIGEQFRSNIVRIFAAKRLMNEGRHEAAIQLLIDNYQKVIEFRSPRVTSEYEALLAQSYRETGNASMARFYALKAIDSAVKNEYTEPLVLTYRLLYLQSKEQGDVKSALQYHEKYMAADKGYLDDVSARQIAYQRIKQEVEAGKLQIDALNRQNQVLHLQGELRDKAIENIRLYIALLAVILISIALWAYKTKRSQMHFKKLSRRDGLTGIFNRPHFIELAENTLKLARKNGEHVCVVLCDLDHFKSVNDNYGHAQGDYVLQRAVAAIQAHLRSSDVFARIGGEEFGILLAGCSVEDARHRVERLRVAVSESNPTDGKFKISASFGIATASSSGYELRVLMTHADTALYQAKRAGRDRVAVFDSASTDAKLDGDASAHSFDNRAIQTP